MKRAQAAVWPCGVPAPHGHACACTSARCPPPSPYPPATRGDCRCCCGGKWCRALLLLSLGSGGLRPRMPMRTSKFQRMRVCACAHFPCSLAALGGCCCCFGGKWCPALLLLPLGCGGVGPPMPMRVTARLRVRFPSPPSARGGCCCCCGSQWCCPLLFGSSGLRARARPLLRWNLPMRMSMRVRFPPSPAARGRRCCCCGGPWGCVLLLLLGSGSPRTLRQLPRPPAGWQRAPSQRGGQYYTWPPLHAGAAATVELNLPLLTREGVAVGHAAVGVASRLSHCC